MPDSKQQSGFCVDELYSSDEIQRALSVGNAGGVRVSIGNDGVIRRAVIMTSAPTARQARENPYHDRIENGILVYTGAGLEGHQSLGGVNKRLPQQLSANFPMYGFMIIGSRRDRKLGPKRWKFLGLLEYLRHYPDTQVDTRGEVRKVWLFEFRIHKNPTWIPLDVDYRISDDVLTKSRATYQQDPDDQEVAETGSPSRTMPNHDPVRTEAIRSKLLGVEPQQFETLIKELLVHSGFERVAVTKYSQDGGVDVNAHAAPAMWPLQNVLVQVQAKRWLHTVGRKEVAELRGSLQPHARGAIVTTSHYSRAATTEANEQGKLPLVLVDGFALANLFLTANIPIRQ
ncbi:MAG: restriction endonuclease [Phycisphaeraceae bacterium]